MRDMEAGEVTKGGHEDDGVAAGEEAGGIVLIVTMLAAVGWYFFDAAGRSTRVENLILIVPMSIAAMLIGGGLIGSSMLRIIRARQQAPRLSINRRAAADWRLAIIAVLLVGYAFSLETIGLDVATALFLSGTFAALGVRGWIGLVLAPVLTALAVAAAMKVAFYIYVPTLLLGWI